MTPLLALEFPPISHLIEWPDLLFEDTVFAINKVTALMLIGAVITVGIFVLGARKQLVPRGIQNFVETIVEFVRDQVALQVIGPDGLKWIPFLLTLFSFIATLNLLGLFPGVQMPVNARMAIPAALAILIWFIYMFLGMKHQGPIGFFKNIMFPPGVPKPIYVLLTPIEFVSAIVVRPFSLAVRLFANLLAGHLILVSFAVLTQALWDSTKVAFVLPFALLVVLTVFEVLVALLQAYIFTILTAVYIGGSLHPDH